ncbi:hypothetical protein [Agarivorans sp. Toyoura001]|uniref:hypothetical protein n=1 Tax=unclassified Agarivorans TaxID=2636026 RepID=UPI0010D94308|nr:hypothetical protein [Agarivorans sp. Toyoura001]GDY24512.1 hypothetical protein AHAT_04020 [Agarivorans sp. Toyoura001]
MLKKSVIALSILLASGCSSIVSDSKYLVAIDSTPSQASFSIKNRAGVTVQNGQTPETLTLKASAGFFKGETYQLVFNKEGYEEQIIELKSSVDGWYFGNILFGGLIGMLIVDPATGAMYKLPENAIAELTESEKENKESLTIAMLNSIPEQQQAQLIPLTE